MRQSMIIVVALVIFNCTRDQQVQRVNTISDKGVKEISVANKVEECGTKHQKVGNVFTGITRRKDYWTIVLVGNERCSSCELMTDSLEIWIERKNKMKLRLYYVDSDEFAKDFKRNIMNEFKVKMFPFFIVLDPKFVVRSVITNGTVPIVAGEARMATISLYVERCLSHLHGT